jgi:hypothetical protein
MEETESETKHHPDESDAVCAAPAEPPRIAVDPAIVEVAMALTAVFGLFTTLDNPLPIRILGVLGFVLAANAADHLYWCFMVSRIPRLAEEEQSARQLLRRFCLSLRLARRWLSLLRLSMSARISLDDNAEYGYLSIYWAFYLFGLLLGFLIMLSFV